MPHSRHIQPHVLTGHRRLSTHQCHTSPAVTVLCHRGPTSATTDLSMGWVTSDDNVSKSSRQFVLVTKYVMILICAVLCTAVKSQINVLYMLPLRLQYCIHCRLSYFVTLKLTSKPSDTHCPRSMCEWYSEGFFLWYHLYHKKKPSDVTIDHCRLAPASSWEHSLTVTQWLRTPQWVAEDTLHQVLTEPAVTGRCLNGCGCADPTNLIGCWNIHTQWPCWGATLGGARGLHWGATL